MRLTWSRGAVLNDRSYEVTVCVSCGVMRSCFVRNFVSLRLEFLRGGGFGVEVEGRRFRGLNRPHFQCRVRIVVVTSFLRWRVSLRVWLIDFLEDCDVACKGDSDGCHWLRFDRLAVLDWLRYLSSRFRVDLMFSAENGARYG